MRAFPPSLPLEGVEDAILEQLRPALQGETRGVPAYPEGSLPSNFWEAISSLAYALYLPALATAGGGVCFVVAGEEGPRGLVLRGHYGPPGHGHSFLVCEALEDLACDDREALRRLHRDIVCRVRPARSRRRT